MKCWAHHFITETASRHKQPAAHTSTQSPIKTRIFHTWTSLPAASFTSIHRDCWQETENSTHPNSSIVRENTLGQNSPAAGGTRFNKTHGLTCRMWIFVAVPWYRIFYDSGDILLWTTLRKSGTRVSASQADPQQLFFQVSFPEDWVKSQTQHRQDTGWPQGAAPPLATKDQ